MLYECVVDKDRNFYWGEKIKSFGQWNKNWKGQKVFEIVVDAKRNRTKKINLRPILTKINEEEGCPIVFVSGVKNQRRSNYPCLKTFNIASIYSCLLYTSPSPRDQRGSRMPSSA